MATVTDPIILDSTGQAIKNSIDLLSANINRTASNIPYDSNLTIKGKIDEIDAKTADDIPYSSGVSVKKKIDDYHDWHSIASNVQSADVSGTDYNEYLVTVLLTHSSPYGCVTFHLFRGTNALMNATLLHVAGDWATGQYGTAVELLVNLSGNIVLNSVYSNGQNVKSSAKMYITGKY